MITSPGCRTRWRIPDSRARRDLGAGCLRGLLGRGESQPEAPEVAVEGAGESSDKGWRAVLFDYPYFEREYRIDPTGTRVLKNPGGPGTLISKARFAQLDKVAHLVLLLFNAFGAVEKTGDTSQLRLTLSSRCSTTTSCGC